MGDRQNAIQQNHTKPGLLKEGIGFGSSLYRFTWFGAPCNDQVLKVSVLGVHCIGFHAFKA